MKWEENEGHLYREIEPIVRSMGYSFVEFARKETKFGLQIRAVIYHYSGVGIEDCEKVYKAIMPRIELAEESTEINLEVTSPGIMRTIKNAAEFTVFIDREVKILLNDETWVEGSILGANPQEVSLRMEEQTKEIPLADIRKAKLTVS
jgi:ribosome maturation factor RimP